MNSVVQFLKRVAQILFFLVVVVFLGALLIGVGSLIVALRYPAEILEKPAILALDLDGIIVDTRDNVESLRKYRTEGRIKGVLLRINSPGVRVRDKFNAAGIGFASRHAGPLLPRPP
jgi:ClpP class serine protease